MKPIKLVIEGVNSFIEAQTLDFEAAGRSNLFCISGKTGAGKTTIFDSLMLALYGKCGKGNLADVVNLSRKTASVVLDFSEGDDIYRVERVIKCRTDKGASDGKTEKRTATSECTLTKNGTVIANGSDRANDEIVKIVGLEWREFKNVYLLEQGEYAEFLKMTPGDQTVAVGKIFSLMRFGDVFKKANEHLRSEQDAADNAKKHIFEFCAMHGITTDEEQSMFPEADDKRIAALELAAKERSAEEAKALGVLRTKTTNLGKELAAKREELTLTEKARDAYMVAREKQNAVRTLTVQLEGEKQKCGNAERALEEFKKTVDNELDGRLRALRETLNEKSVLNALDREYAAAVADVAQKTAELEKRRADERDVCERSKEYAERRDNDKKAFEESVRKFTNEAQAAERRSDALDNCIALLGEPTQAAGEVLYSLRDELKKYETIEKEYKEKLSRRDEKSAEAEKLLVKTERYEAELNSIREGIVSAEKAESDAEKALTAARIGSHAAAVRSELAPGDVCPVCGGIYGGGESGCDADVEKRKAEYDEAVNALKAARNREAEGNKYLALAKADYGRACLERDGFAAEAQKAEAELGALCVDKDVYKKLTDTATEAKTCGERAAQSESEYIKFEPALSRARAQTEGAEKALSDAQATADGYKQKLGDAAGKTDDIVKELREDIDRVESAYSAQTEKLKTLEGEADAARRAVAAVESSLVAAQEACPAEIPEFDEGEYTLKKEYIEQLNKHIAENEREIAVRDAELKNFGDSRKMLGEQIALYKSLSERVDLYRKIAEITKGKAMLNYVAAEYIAEFTAIASEILNELSGGKYTMDHDKNNGFIVSDYLNGGKARKTDTLSGGELFLASLSVAIAIARTQSNGNNAFFFLDEGFGTLDDELLDTVYGALESLSRECLVGVITHSGALIEKMPSVVTVAEATDTSGSKILQ